MPNIKSAKKRERQNKKRNEQNSQKKSTIRTFEKRIRKSLVEDNLEQASQFFSIFTSLIDKSAKSKFIHKNKANRKKSRMARLLANFEKKFKPNAEPESSVSKDDSDHVDNAPVSTV